MDSKPTLEVLEKKCPRCGGSSANSSNPAGRCSACLKKLKTAKKTPGHWQRAQTKADDALRRQKGKNGTASKKSSGLGTRESIVKQTQSAEKKTGQKLSPDRKNNSKGYAAKNTRMVPEKLNRGRHHVDGKKLRAWQKRLKKTDISDEELYTYVLAKAEQSGNQELLTLLHDMHENDLANFINNHDDGADAAEDSLPLKKTELLAKELPIAGKGLAQPSIHNMIGQTHTVEVHPHMDHLYNVKGMIKDSGKPHMQLNDIKRAGVSKKIIDKLPRDAKGKVTPEMIDEHIKKLPKQKVQINIAPYKLKMQQHRDDVPQYTASVGLHPDTLARMDEKTKNTWNAIKGSQHNLDGHKHQVGWARIDPFKATGEGKRVAPNEGHWHVDEIQSDFGSKDKLKNRHLNMDTGSNNINHELYPYHKAHSDAVSAVLALGLDYKERIKHPNWTASKKAEQTLHDKIIEYRNKNYAQPEELHELLSHGHEDPQHLVHSAINQLGRQNGIKSMSMDMPQDQAEQSGLSIYERPQDPEGLDEAARDAQNEAHENAVDVHLQDNFTPEHYNQHIEESENPYLKNALKKLGHENAKLLLSRAMHSSDPVDSAKDHLDETYNEKEISNPERDALIDYARKMTNGAPQYEDFDDVRDNYRYEHGQPDEVKEEDRKKVDLPIHQINTYDKRPKALGMKPIDKRQLLGPHHDDKQKEVQYMMLRKKLQYLCDLLKKAK